MTMRFMLVLFMLAFGAGASAQTYSANDLQGTWRLTSQGRTVDLTLENDSGWVLGQYQDGGRDVSFGIRSRAGATVFIEKVSGPGATDTCEGQVAANGRRIAGTCEASGAFSMTR